jgi:endonuclease-3
MATTSNKQRLLGQVFSTLKKRYHPVEAESRPVLSQFVYAICREGSTQAKADQAFRNLHERFFDWNEIRVSSPREVAECFDDGTDAEARAQRLISLLQEVFETTYSFDLDSLHKKGLKQSAKQLSRYQAASEYAVASVVQGGLGGHAIPIDAPGLRTLRRLGLVEVDQDDPESIQATLQHIVPKARGSLFADLIGELANELCLDDEPQCGNCPLAAECPAGQEAARKTVSHSRSSRAKSR